MTDEMDERTLTDHLQEWALDGLQEAQESGDTGVVAIYRQALAYLSSSLMLCPLLSWMVDAFPA